MDTMELVNAIKDEIDYQKEFENIFDLGTDFDAIEGRDSLSQDQIDKYSLETM
jgi:hypothetical protein